MTLDPTVQDLVERYPDDLTDADLATLRALVERDPAIEALLDSIHRADAFFAGVSPAPASLSPGGRARLADRLRVQGVSLAPPPRGNVVPGPTSWSTGGATPSGVQEGGPPGDGTPSGAQGEGPTAWSTGGATPSGAQGEGPTAWSTGGATPSGAQGEGPTGWSTGGATPSGSRDDAVVDLASARRRGRRMRPAALAAAAVLMLAAGFVVRDALRPPPPAFTFKGDGSEGALRGSLFVRGEARLQDGERRPMDQPVTFRAVMTDAASLALLETQHGRTFVLWPPPGQEWRVTPGTHLLRADGSSVEYRPRTPGAARYTLLARSGPFDIPLDREVESPESFGAMHDGAVGLDDITVLWEEPTP